jgi:methanogenic corrinoid protein MtbC1
MTTGVDTTAAFERFLELMLRADRRTATREAVALVESGMPLADFVLEILAPVQAEIGRRWQHAESHLTTSGWPPTWPTRC